MITSADLSSYGLVIDAVEAFMDALPVDCYLNRPDQEIVASNAPAVAKGLVQGVKCHSLVSDKRCPWCHAAQALRSRKPVDYIVHVGVDENGNMKVVDTGGIVADAHWYPVAADLYVHFVGICQPMVSAEEREGVYGAIRTFLEKLSPDGAIYAEKSTRSIQDAMKEHDYS
jgi:hypothetical protein